MTLIFKKFFNIRQLADIILTKKGDGHARLRKEWIPLISHLCVGASHIDPDF